MRAPIVLVGRNELNIGQTDLFIRRVVDLNALDIGGQYPLWVLRAESPIDFVRAGMSGLLADEPGVYGSNQAEVGVLSRRIY